MKLLSLTLCLAAGLALVQPCAAQSGVFTNTGSLAVGHDSHTATLLPNGKVLVAAGVNGPTDENASAVAELYNPATGTWSTTGSLGTARYVHTATLLTNGKVLVAAGFSDTAGYLASAELYNPATGTWAPTGSLGTARFFPSATLLPNGKVLVAGGFNDSAPALATSELYDPATGVWSPTGSLVTARFYQTATLLPNGKVLVAGGNDGSGGPALASAELYDPTSGTWTATGSLATARALQTATLLSNGKVLVAGGRSSGVRFASAELYNPATGTWAATGSLGTARVRQTASLLPNGQVLVTGGINASGVATASAELYDPASGIWAATGSLIAARIDHTATSLPNGGVLVAGGNDGSNALTSTELYVMASAFSALSPARVWDSRSGPGPTGQVGAAQSRDITVTGVGGVPATGVTAVVLNVAAINPTAQTFATVWPTGETRPLAANLNVPPNDVRANLVVVKVGTGGKVSVFNNAGNADFVADVAGWYGPAAGDRYTPVSPARVWDTRSGPGPVGRIPAAGSRNLTVAGVGGVPATGVTAVVLNVAAVNPSAKTFITAWPAGEARPLAANLNVPAGDVRANLVYVKVGASGQVSFFNNAGDVDLVADVAGYFGTTGSKLHIVSPTRVWDSRSGPGPVGQLGPAASRNLTVAGAGGVPATGATAVVLNIAAVHPSARTFITAWPAGEAQPLAANLNVPAGDVRPNLGVVKIGTGGQVSFYNNAGSVDLVADLAGWYGASGE